MSFFRNWFYCYVRPTTAEVAFERLICLLGEPYRAQYPFPGLRRIADFALPERRIVIEIDGASHDLLVQRRKDITSTIALEEKGWRVIRFTNAEVSGIDAPVQIREIIESKLIHRPILPELREALAQLPEPPVKPSRPRKKKPAPVQVSARKRGRPKGSKSSGPKVQNPSRRSPKPQSTPPLV